MHQSATAQRLTLCSHAGDPKNRISLTRGLAEKHQELFGSRSPPIQDFLNPCSISLLIDYKALSTNFLTNGERQNLKNSTHKTRNLTEISRLRRASVVLKLSSR